MNPDTIEKNWPGEGYEDDYVEQPETVTEKWKPKQLKPEPTILNFIAGKFDRRELKDMARFKKMCSRICN